MGNDNRKTNSAIKKRRIESIAHDIIYSATGGSIKPSKQLLLGLAVKSMTGSRRLIEILNRLGHSINYHTIEELETELTYSSLVDQWITPHGMSMDPTLCLGVAFDNFDHYVETSSGKNTLHDTVGIAYQDVFPTGDEDIHVPRMTEKKTSRKPNNRRSYEAINLTLEPYHKKPKIKSSVFLPMADERRRYVPPSLIISRLLDDLWMLSLYLLPDATPMWVDWNSRIKNCEDDVSQKVYYLPQIDLSPTSNTVVIETLKIAQRIAEETKKAEICVTYDLAIAKMALQIQAEESPRFDNTFIFVGAFHTEAAYFNALGTFLAESGGPSILIACDILASRSLKGFITGKHYNR